MKVKCLKSMFVNGKQAITGDEFEVSEKDGNYLVNRKFAELVADKPKAKPKAKAKK